MDVAVLMSDCKRTIPAVDDERRLLGVITVDDVLEVTLPDDWRRRRPPNRRTRTTGRGVTPGRPGGPASARQPEAGSGAARQKPATPQLAKPASAVLDDAHLGDIEGAFGWIELDGERRTGMRRLG